MELRYIYTRSSVWEQYKEDMYSDFSLTLQANERFICNWLSKAVRKLHIETSPPIKSLSFTHSPIGTNISIDFSEGIVHCNLLLSATDQERLQQMSILEDRYEFFLSYLERGYKEVSERIILPIDQLLDLHDQFRQNGYRNEWLFKKKMIREYGLYVFLKCYFTTFDFHLELEAYDLKKTHLIAKDIIFRSFPDELCYDKDFRSIQVEGSKLQILNFLGKAEMAVDLEALTQGRVVVDYIDDDFLNWEERKESTRKAIERITW